MQTRNPFRQTSNSHWPVLISAMLLVAATVVPTYARTCTSPGGRTFEGELQSFDEESGMVTVRTPEGRLLHFSKDKVSAADNLLLDSRKPATELKPSPPRPAPPFSSPQPAYSAANVSLPVFPPPSAAPSEGPAYTQLPRPDGREAEHSKKLRVFILMGEVNMLGMGHLGPVDKPGTLAHVTPIQKRFEHLTDGSGGWSVRKDTRYVRQTYKEPDRFNDWLMPDRSGIGPELQFGHIMGHSFEESVLILKACDGNRSLGWDLLPPGSERFEHGGKVYAGYKDTPASWQIGTEPKPSDWYAGKQYDDSLALAKEVLENLSEYYPGYLGQGYEISGFFFFQGVKDQNAVFASRYEINLVNFIKAVRQAFDAPFVVATGCGNPGRAGHGLAIAEAQLAVDGDTGNYPEFKGNMRTVDVRDFWPTIVNSPSSRDQFSYNNAEYFLMVGDRAGIAMLDLIKQK